MRVIFRIHAWKLLAIACLLLCACNNSSKTAEEKQVAKNPGPKESGSKIIETPSRKKQDASKNKNTPKGQAHENEYDPYHFEDVTGQTKINFVPHTGIEARQFTMIEELGTGAAMFDADRDGWMDLFFVGGGNIEPGIATGEKHGLFRNLGKLEFQDITEQADIDETKYYSHGAVVGDYDNDGFEDLLVTGFGGVQFYRNQGDGSFLDTPLPGIAENFWSNGAAFADIDGDQILDLYIANYIDWTFEKNKRCFEGGVDSPCTPRMFEGRSDSLYFSNGDGSFMNVTDSSGLVELGKGMAVLACDFDQDLDMDIYVSNDTVPNFLYVNDGKGNLSEVAFDRGAAAGADGEWTGSMGSALCDYNNDQKFDFWVTNFMNESAGIYKNVGENYFYHAGFVTGVSRIRHYVAWGTAWSDVDFDGDEDVFVTNGHVHYNPDGSLIAQAPVVLINESERFIRIPGFSSPYLRKSHRGRGLVAGDLDNDGDEDFAITHSDQPVAVLRNDVDKKGDWVCVELIGTSTNRFAIGATLTLETDQASYIRQVVSGGSYISSNDRRVFWGIPAGLKIERLTVRWPSGIEQTVNDIAVNRLTTIVEPRIESKE